MKPSNEEIIAKYQSKINEAKKELEPYQIYYEANKDYKGNNFEKKLALKGAWYMVFTLLNKIKSWNLKINNLKIIK